MAKNRVNNSFYYEKEVIMHEKNNVWAIRHDC